MNQTAHESIQQLFTTLGIQDSFTLTDEDGVITLELSGEENALLIGYHGETLEALQIIIGLMLAKKTGVYTPVSLEVGEYKKKRVEHLKEIIANIKEEVISQNRAVAFPRLKSWERRFIHTYLKDDEAVMTKSEGEGRERTLLVCPKE